MEELVRIGHDVSSTLSYCFYMGLTPIQTVLYLSDKGLEFAESGSCGIKTEPPSHSCTQPSNHPGNLLVKETRLPIATETLIASEDGSSWYEDKGERRPLPADARGYAKGLSTARRSGNFEADRRAGGVGRPVQAVKDPA
jgi:hypothetical protein